jgi:hypothetical protein
MSRYNEDNKEMKDKIGKEKKVRSMKLKISPTSPFRKKAQEEMVGFALILIIVAVIFIVLLAVYIKRPQVENVGSPEVSSFLQSSLQYTTICEQDIGNVTIQSLISKCNQKEECLYNKDPCKVLNDTLKGIIIESWNIGPENPVRGYNLIINISNKQFLNLTGGVVTNNYKSSEQDLGKEEGLISLLFHAYS